MKFRQFIIKRKGPRKKKYNAGFVLLQHLVIANSSYISSTNKYLLKKKVYIYNPYPEKLEILDSDSDNWSTTCQFSHKILI